MPDIHQRLLINAPVEKVFDAITTQKGLAAWWTPAATATPGINSIARFPFGAKYFKEMKVTELTPPTQLKWTCITGAEEWIGTTISFELQSYQKETLLTIHPELGDQLQQQSNGDTGTVLIFQHNDWKAYTPMFGECSYTWGRFLRSLKLFCESGNGLPWPYQHRITKH
jgi:uncharacterized protein YndB with AHSA1/START domain